MGKKGRQQESYQSSRQKALESNERRLVKLFESGQFQVMETEARAVLQKSPGDLFALKALASARLSANDHEEARVLFLKLVERTPDDWSVWTNLGSAERALGNLEAAINAYEKGLGLDSSNAEICADLAHLCRLVNDHERALKWFFAALQADSESTDYFVEWVSTLDRLGRFEHSIASLKLAWEHEPDNPKLAVTTMVVAKSLAEWELATDAAEFLERERKQGRLHGVPPLHLVATEGLDRVELRQIMQGLLNNLSKKNFKLNHPLCSQGLQATVENRHARLRIGYLSADLHTHATSILITGVLEAHAQQGLDLYVYSYGPEDADSEFQNRIRAVAIAFHDVRYRNDAHVISQIMKDEIDILVDLKGWTMDFRVAIQGLRPAPIVVTWLGFPGTIGHTLLADYVIGDPVVTPLEHADGYTETLALMPHCYQPNDNKRVIGNMPTREEMGLPETGFVFCSFNRCDKITRKMLSLWCEMLNAVPNSVLWLLSDSTYAQENMLRVAMEHGVDRERFIFAPRVSAAEHLGRLGLADLALDSYPYTSHTTGSDALWAGVPLLALQGGTFASRVSSSLVTAAGIPEMVTTSFSEYRQKALELAKSPELLSQIRVRLISGRNQCALFDTAGFARDLGRLYQTMWRNYQNGVKAPIALEPE